MTYGAYFLLASALLLIGWRTLLVTAPLIVFGAFFSGIRYFLGVENGIPYLWAVLAATILTLLLWRHGSARAAPLFCFTAGMVSSYLWLFDGHNFLAIALIGLIGWLGHERLNTRDRVRRVSSYLLLYAVGFILCFAANQVTKTVVYEQAIVGGSNYFGGGVATHLFSQVLYHLERIFSPEDRDLYGRSIVTFWGLSLSSIRPTVGIALTGLSALALLGAGFFARYQARRGHPELARNILWIVGIMLLACVNFLQPNDLPYRVSRIMFVPLALCWSCLILAVMDAAIPRWIVRIADRLPWRNRLLQSVNWRHATWAGLFLFATALYWHNPPILILPDRNTDEGRSRERTFLLEADEIRSSYQQFMVGEPIIRADFDVYHNKGSLLYVKEKCTDADAAPRFSLHVFPVDQDNLPASRWPYGFDNLDFFFDEYGFRHDGRCVVGRNLPDYRIARIRTSQFTAEGQLWKGEHRFGGKDATP